MDIHIHVEKRHLYILSLLVLIIGGVLFVRGQGSSNFGHSASDVYVSVNGEEYSLQEVIDGIYDVSWETKNVDTVYQAEETGFVVVNPMNAGYSYYKVFTGLNESSLIERVYGKSVNSYGTKAPVSVPVKKGEYWKVVRDYGNEPQNIWWVALGI